MPKVQEVIDLIEKFAPLNTQEEWDNSGWQINLGHENFSRIMTAVTITQDIIKQAKAAKCDLILSHHPYIFDPIKSIDDIVIIEAIKNGIQIYSAHTSIDHAKGGTTDTLSEVCGFGFCENTLGFVKYKQLEKEYDIDFLIEDIKKRLNIDCIKIVNMTERKTIKSIAFCAGAGGFEIPCVNELGINLYITGEIKFHEAFEAKDTVIFEVGHYDSEKYIGQIFRKILGNKYEIIEADEKNTYCYK